jgi:uncharacterized OB-fold protein
MICPKCGEYSSHRYPRCPHCGNVQERKTKDITSDQEDELTTDYVVHSIYKYSRTRELRF